MNQSPAAARPRTENETTVESESEVQDLLTALSDEGCHAILGATSDEALSAKELMEACELPRSTTYRKLEILTSAGLLETEIRLRPGQKPVEEYHQRVEDVAISITESGTPELRVFRNDRA